MTRDLPDDDPRKFWFNTPKRAFHSLARTWEFSPTSDRIVEDIFEFFNSIDAVVESEGTFVELNLRNGRRLLNFAPTKEAKNKKKKRKRLSRKSDASVDKMKDLHPHADWCGKKMVVDIMESDLKVEAMGTNMKQLPPCLDPEEIGELGFEGACSELVPEHTMNLHNAKDPDAEKMKEEERIAKKRKKAEAAAASRAATKKAKPAKTLKAKKPRPKKKKFNGFPGYYPPSGHRMEFEAEGEWFEGWFEKMEEDCDGDELCYIRDPETGETHKILLREEDEHGEWMECVNWHPLWPCEVCDCYTCGKFECEMCHKAKEVEDD